jgi:hypothetical protein
MAGRRQHHADPAGEPGAPRSIPRHAHGIVSFDPSRRRSCMQVRFRHFGQILPSNSNLEPIFLMLRVASTLGLLAAIRCLFTALVGRKQIIGHDVGHL